MIAYHTGLPFLPMIVNREEHLLKNALLILAKHNTFRALLYASHCSINLAMITGGHDVRDTGS